MTSERKAKGMLAKLATLSCCVRRGFAFCVFIVTCAGVVACSYRSLDRAALQAKTSVSATPASIANEHPSSAASETRDARSAITAPWAETQSSHAEVRAHAMRTRSGDSTKTYAVPSFDDVIGDASLTLSSREVDEKPTFDIHRAAAAAVAAPVALPEHAVATDGKRLAGMFHWGLLLGMVALIALAGLGLALVLDRRRHHRLRMHVALQPTFSVVPSLADDAVPGPEQNEIDVMPPPVSDDDALPMLPAPTTVTLAEDGASAAHADAGPIPPSRWGWRYQPGKFDVPEHWAVESPVDFLPSLPTRMIAGPPESMTSAVSIAPDVGVEAASVIEPVNAAPASQSASDDDPLSQLFDQLENSAMPESGDVPVLLIERDSDLPQIVRTTSEPVSQQVLQAWESRLRQAMAGARSLTLPSLLISTLLLRAEQARPQDVETLYAEAEEWIDLSMAADQDRRAAWEARRVDVDLRRAKQKKGAARLLWLRGMQTHYAPQLAQGQAPVLFAWVQVLMFWAQCQFGDAALARYADAEAICLRLGELPACADVAQRYRAELLRQRATIEQGGARLQSLDTAQALTDALHERAPSAEHALAVAVTALARGNVLPPAQAKEAYSHALVNAFMAEGDPRLREQALQCRLAVQWAYENLPGMGAQSDIALKLAQRLDALHVKDPDTLQRMAQTYLRSADFVRACEFCEHAWRNGHATPALLSIWQEACRQWAAVAIQPEQLAVRQQTMRQLSIASAMR